MQQSSVLVIAGEEDMKSYHSLQPQGVEMTALGLNDCVDCLESKKVDVILLDCGYRVWKGMSLLRQIKQACKDTAIVFLTDQESEDIETNAVTEGATAYIKKPVNLYDLKQSIERLLIMKNLSEGRRLFIDSPGQTNGSSYTRTITTDKPHNLLQVVAYIEENLLSALELESLAKKAHLSKYHFCRIFKYHIGMNPMKFVAALRVERALGLRRSVPKFHRSAPGTRGEWKSL